MFANDDLIFLHLQKAAGSYIADSLSLSLPGAVRDGHAPLREPRGNRRIVASIRDPWDWYISLWAYGCKGDGAVYGRHVASHGTVVNHALRAVLRGRARPRDALTRIRLDRNRDRDALRDLYATSDDPERFRRWLRYVLTQPGCGHLPDEYSLLPMAGQVGFMSFWVLRLFTDWQAWSTGAQAITRPMQALKFFNCNSIVDDFLRVEHLDEDLDRLLSDFGAERSASRNFNRSKRHDQVSFYYDREAVELVREKDAMLLDVFGYTPPEIRE